MPPADALPHRTDDLAATAAAAEACTRCPLYRDATRVVFGEGPPDARLMMVGEQPGDREDIEGRPFVGPAGRVLDEALAAAGIDRGSVYLTNAVKHFKHEPRGKRRLHKKPNAGEIKACRWWLEKELEIVAPTVVVALGVTAATSLLARPVVLSREAEQPLRLADGRTAILTVHPSALLRLRDRGDYAPMLDALASALRRGAELATGVPNT